MPVGYYVVELQYLKLELQYLNKCKNMESGCLKKRKKEENKEVQGERFVQMRPRVNDRSAFSLGRGSRSTLSLIGFTSILYRSGGSHNTALPSLSDVILH